MSDVTPVALAPTPGVVAFARRCIAAGLAR